MARDINSAGVRIIKEPAHTATVTYTEGVFNLPHIHGGKVKGYQGSTGTVQVHYIGDAAGIYRDLEILDADTWYEDRIDQIIEAGTEIPAANLLVCW